MTTTSEAKESLALKLKNARKSKRISAQKLAKLLSVPESTIEAIEDPQNMDLPLANLVGLTNRYATEVDLSQSEIAEEMAVLKPRPQSKTKKTVKAPGSRVFVASKATAMLVIGAILFVVLSYAAWQAWQLVAAPSLSLETPTQNLVTSEQQITVKGKASSVSSVLVNGSNVSLADDGSFETIFYLQPGQNFLQVRALNALGHEAVEDVIITSRQ